MRKVISLCCKPVRNRSKIWIMFLQYVSENQSGSLHLILVNNLCGCPSQLAYITELLFFILSRKQNLINYCLCSKYQRAIYVRQTFSPADQWAHLHPDEFFRPNWKTKIKDTCLKNRITCTSLHKLYIKLFLKHLYLKYKFIKSNF